MDESKLPASHFQQRIEELERQNAKKQAELEKAKKLAYLGIIATEVTREVGQPLGIIRAISSNALNLIKKGLLKPETIESALKNIYIQGEQLHIILDNFQRMAQSDLSHREKINLNKLLQIKIEYIKELFDVHPIQFVMQLSDNLPFAWSNPLPLKEILHILLTNAKEAIAAQKQQIIWITTFCEANQVGFRVEDNGRGLTEEYRQYLFMPFKTTKPSDQGMGLGLYIANKMLEDLGGKLSYTDRKEGGACFIVNLPIFTG